MSKPLRVPMSNPVTPIEEGKYVAIISQIIQLGAQHFKKKDGSSEWDSPQIMIGYELPSLTYENRDGDTVTKIKSEKYFFSMNPSKNGLFGLRELIDGIRGSSEWTEAELEAFDLTSYLGKRCMVTISSVVSKGQTYSNITAVEPMGDEAAGMVTGNRKLQLVTTEDFMNPSIMESLPGWIQDIIRQSVEWREQGIPAPVNEISDERPAAAPVTGDINMEKEIKLEDVPF